MGMGRPSNGSITGTIQIPRPSKPAQIINVKRDPRVDTSHAETGLNICTRKGMLATAASCLGVAPKCNIMPVRMLPEVHTKNTCVNPPSMIDNRNVRRMRSVESIPGRRTMDSGGGDRDMTNTNMQPGTHSVQVIS